MDWSHYSKAIFDAFLLSDDNILVQACPGAGKTTNIKHMWSLTDASTCYLVFNKHNQVEAQSKMPARSGSAVLTLNGLGHRAIMNTYGRVELDSKKVMSIIKQHMPWPSLPYKKRSEMQYTLCKAVDTVKMLDTDGYFTAAQLDDAISTYDLEEYTGMYDDVQRILDISDNTVSVIDFNDQIRLPAISDAVIMPQYDIVMGDEVQDFSPVQAAMISKMKSRYVLVGDKHQSIYGFRGAMANSMSILQSKFNCVELPLSITYRCATDIVKEARVLYHDIEPWCESPQGTVRRCEHVQVEPQQFDKDTLVLCRNNRPLIDLAFSLLQNNIACHVRGRDIGDGLVKLIKQQGCNTVSQLITSLSEWLEVQQQKAVAKDDDAIAQRASDKYNSIMVFIGKCNVKEHPDAVISLINTLFEQGRGVCLSTVHKAKGLEAQRCYLLEHRLFKDSQHRAKYAWQREQERNVEYVAITRAKNELVYM